MTTTALDFIVRLQVNSGAKSGKELVIARLPFVIGAEGACHLKPSSPLVSPQHCILHRGAGGLAITDLASDTGTWVNDERITRTTPIGDGDELRVGPLHFRLRVQSILPAPSEAPDRRSSETTPEIPVPTSQDTLPEIPVPPKRPL